MKSSALPAPTSCVASAATLPDHESAERVRWHLVPRFMLRVGGLPFETAAVLATPASAAWADGVLDARRRLRERGARLADFLQERVAQSLDDPAARRTLINLRRDVFNARAPRGLAAAEPLLAATELAELREWSADRQRHEALLRTGSGILAEESAAARRELRRAATETDLRHGIQLSSPSLDEYLDGYLHRAAWPAQQAGEAHRTVTAGVPAAHRVQDQPVQHTDGGVRGPLRRGRMAYRSSRPSTGGRSGAAPG